MAGVAAHLCGTRGIVLRRVITPLTLWPRWGGAAAAADDAAAMRVMVLISSLATGGAERVTVSFLSHAASRDTDIRACTVTAAQSEPLAAQLAAAGVRRYNLKARRLADPFALARLLRLLRRERIGLIHAHGQDASILAACARGLTRIPLVITRHVLDEPADTWRRRLRAAAAFWAIRHADAVVAVSAATADYLAAHGRIARRRIQVIPNGIDLERFGGAGHDARRTKARVTLGLTPEDPVVLVPAVLRRGKGHETLIEALPALRARVPGVRVLFAGGGELEPALRALAEPHRETIMMLGPREDIPALLAACDLVVLPSYTEALPTALLEAAAAGRPAVATRVGGTSEVIQDNRTGLLVPAGDVAGLVTAITALLRDPQRAHAFGQAARRLARERFALGLQFDRTIALWSALARDAGR